ncbi:protein of unknown function [Bartonella clarridgeiae 73]|uniref:Uncharacterized protein n=1 Tax=Bartonella clarridgeiae (strain CCUG 45776 / CIP 104772 / 73) TaxID=696125 RepID=E6YIN4_BARC7|nr:MAG: hypothetical protein PG977_000106 [Bartonella clarridgeiae]CBI76722.1 protein of unknown function [Bartonella clarridgeiae 73]
MVDYCLRDEVLEKKNDNEMQLLSNEKKLYSEMIITYYGVNSCFILRSNFVTSGYADLDFSTFNTLTTFLHI